MCSALFRTSSNGDRQQIFSYTYGSFQYGQHEDDYVLDVDKSILEKEEGFDRNEPLTQTELLKAYTQYKRSNLTGKNEVLNYIGKVNY